MSSVTSGSSTPSAPPTLPPAAASALAPAKEAEFNRLHLDFRRPMPRPPVKGMVIDFHTHLIAARHAKVWFEAGHHYGVDAYATMTPLEEALTLARDWPGKLHFITIPAWKEFSIDDWLRRLEAFYNLGSRIIKFHNSPGTIAMRGIKLDSEVLRPVIREAAARKMVLMSHIGDPDIWYEQKYTDTKKYGTREEHYAMWESVMTEYRDHPWLGAHFGGNPENLPRLQSLLDRFPNLYLDMSATRWIAREISARREEARQFILRNSDRLLFGSDQVSGDDRGFDFLASRLWTHRKLWETAYNGPGPILDPDLPEDKQPELHGLALPTPVLQKIYHDNAIALLGRVGATLE